MSILAIAPLGHFLQQQNFWYHKILAARAVLAHGMESRYSKHFMTEHLCYQRLCQLLCVHDADKQNSPPR